MKWEENHEVSYSNPSKAKKTIGDFFTYVQALVGRVHPVHVLVGRKQVPGGIIEVRANWPRHHRYRKKCEKLVVDEKRRLHSHPPPKKEYGFFNEKEENVLRIKVARLWWLTLSVLLTMIGRALQARKISLSLIIKNSRVPMAHGSELGR